MPRICDTCGFENELNHEICRSCGHIMEDVVVARPNAQSEPVTRPPEPPVHEPIETSEPEQRQKGPPPPPEPEPDLQFTPPPETEGQKRARRKLRFKRWRRGHHRERTKGRRKSPWAFLLVVAVMVLVRACSE